MEFLKGLDFKEILMDALWIGIGLVAAKYISQLIAAQGIAIASGDPAP